jgi:hypothetical protein
MEHDRFDELTRRLVGGASRRQVLKILALSVFAGILPPQLRLEAAGVTPDGATPSNLAASDSELIITAISRERISGSIHLGGVGLLFDSQKKGDSVALSIKTLAGKERLAIREADKAVLVSIFEGRLTSRIQKAALDTLHQQIRNARKTLAPKERAAALLELTTTSLSKITTAQGSGKVIGDLKKSPEYALLPTLSFELANLGLTGPAYPPALAIHTSAAGASKLLAVDPKLPGVVFRVKLPPGITQLYLNQHLSIWYPPTDCYNPQSGEPNTEGLPICEGKCKEYPNPDNDCFGVCGPGCKKPCWTWICGDCCYHDFCAFHDKQLRSCDGVTDVVHCLLTVLPPLYWPFFGCS